jgi:hypothetical protein
MSQNQVKLTIGQKTEIFERFFETKKITYQAKVGFTVETEKQNIDMVKLLQVLQVMGLELTIIRNTKQGSIVFLLEIIH